MSSRKTISRRVNLFTWLFLSVCIPVSGQKYFFDNYGINDGLSTQKVYTLLQDSRDYIWLGTANGVSRFDGSKFENFTTRDSLAPGGVRSIIEDSLGYIWFGHLNGGLSRYNGQIFEKAGFDSIKVSGDINGIEQIDNKIWFTSHRDGALMTDFPVKDIRHIRAKQFVGKDGLSDQVFGCTVNKEKSFFCIADVGLRKFNTGEKKFENYRMPHLTTYFNAICLLSDSKGNIWFGTYNGGLYKYIMSESRMEFIDLPKMGIHSNTVNCLTEDTRGRVWIGTWGGGVVVSDGGSFRSFNESNGLAASNIYDIIEDVEGNILIADQSNGLTIFKGDAFVTISGEENLPDPNVNSICEDKNGAMWFGTNKGLSRYRQGSAEAPVIYNNSNSSIFDDVRFIRADKDGNLWIGANEGGVVEFDVQKSRFVSHPEINSSLYIGGQVKAMEIDRQNNLWIGTPDGVAVGTINGQNFTRYNFMDSLMVTVITALHCDQNGDMWIGTELMGGKPGLLKYTARDKKFKKIQPLTGVIPRALATDKNGTLWIGTTEGVKAFRNDSIVTAITSSDGLLSDVVNLIQIGDDGSVYIGTNSGLNRYFPDSKRIFSYTERNGFPGIETKSNAVFRSGNGDLWFGTANGVTQLVPGKASTEQIEPLTHIMGLKVNYASHEMVSGMKLSYRERTVVFDYNSICLTNPDVVRYQVKLDGADNDWQPVTDQTKATYPSLAPGKYTFMVKARNSQGIWNREPITFSFVVKPPFYKTWGFILAMIIIGFLSVVAYINIRERNLKKEKIILEEKVEERTAEVVQKSMEIEEKNRDITASIRYAERIQRAMLPREDMFSDTFVLFMPKDIVSGDFYWMYDNGDHQFIAVCDCTGHGVPGAFMSIIGHNSLHKVVREYGIIRPSAILDQLNTEVLKALMQRNEETINDGMDMSLIAFDRKKFTVSFAGAYNPLYLVRNGEVMVYRADRFPIGMTAISEKKSFTNQEVVIQPGDMLYMCSDGYADQFGSPDVKKYKSGNVKKLLAEIWSLPVEEQRKRLEDEILSWRGNLPQVDDILFVGTRIPQN